MSQFPIYLTPQLLKPLVERLRAVPASDGCVVPPRGA
jgi:hypothetical protein